MILGTDISRWNPGIDFAHWKAQGVEFVIIKASQGDYLVDKLLAPNADGALKAGMVIAFYHWHDPISDPNKSADLFLSAVNKYGTYSALALDVEQHWSDWNDQANPNKFLTPARISSTAQSIIKTFPPTCPHIVYTRTSFINEHAKPMLNWISKYPLWLAQYPFKRGRVITNWEDFRAAYMPRVINPTIPAGCTNLKLWQFTGDKFILPGASSPIDFNLFNGSVEEYRQFFNLDSLPSKPQTLEERIAKLETEARKNGWSI